MKYIRLVLLFWVGCVISMVAQNIVVEGTVLDDFKEPLMGVSVVQEGTTNGVTTKVDGKYSLSVPPNAKLQFSFVGFKTVVEPVNNRKQINVEFEVSAHVLQEVVSLGYSGQKRSELSSAVVSIAGDKLKDVTTSDVGAMLQGRVAGMVVTHASGQPGDDAAIRIRGTGSLGAGSNPLYVVDGIPGGTFSHNDIETITILKDAAATALYGSEGSNGVIVVTTKKATLGQPVSINFKATYGRTKAVSGPLKMMNGAELYDAHRSFYTSPEEMEKAVPSYLRDVSYDWYKAGFDAGNIQDYYLSVAGSSKETTYMVSTNYYQQDGTLINTGYDKLSTRLSLGTKLSNTLNMNIRLNYEKASKRQTSSYATAEGAYGNMPWDVPNDENFDYIKIDGTTRPDNGLGWYTQDTRNFLHSEQYNFAKNKSSNINADFQLVWTIYDWLMFTSNNRFSASDYTYSRYVDPRTADPSYKYGYYRQDLGKSEGWLSSNLLRFMKTFGIHSLTAIAGFEGGRSSNRFTTANVMGTSEESMIPGKATLHGAVSDQGIDGMDSYNYRNISWSAFTQVQYNLLDRYFFTASLRADASSHFAKSRRVGYFPAVSGAWNVTSEEFFPKNDVVTFLKLRTSYGTTGNSSGIPRFGSLRKYAILDGNKLHREEIANKRLSWETAQMATIGVDFRFFDRLDLSVDLYNITNKDLIRRRYLSESQGEPYIIDNAGDMRNKGLEIQLNSDNITTKDFHWNTTFNIAFNKNEIRNQPNIEVKTVGSGLNQVFLTGEDINSWYGKKWLGVDYENGDPLWEKIIVDENGKEVKRVATNNIEDASDQIVGKATPKFTGGFTNSLNYKGIGLDFTASFVYGNDVYNRDREKFDTDGAYQGYNMMRLQSNWRRWENPGDVVTHPKLTKGGNHESNKASSRFLEDGSYFRLKNITLYYDFPQKWIQPLRMKSFRFFVSADNLLTITRFSGIDPEINLDTSDWRLAGTYSYSYPISKQILFGVDIKF